MDYGEKFYKDYFCEGIGDEKRRHVLDKKNHNIPPLFKYTNLNHIEDLLCEDLMFLAPIWRLNDPNEGVISHNIHMMLYDRFETSIFGNLDNFNQLNEKYNYGSNEFEDISIKFSRNEIVHGKLPNVLYDIFLDFDIIQDMTNSLKEDNYILSFSCRNDNYPLWHHYADEHKGICIEYDIKNCNVDFIKDNCFPVFYDDSDFNEDLNSVKNIQTKFMLKPLLKKGTDWQYEQEWRIVLNKDSLIHDIDAYFCGYDNKNYIKFLTPKRIYMGKDIPEDMERKISGICQCRKIELHKMEHNYSQYKLDSKMIKLDKLK